MSDAELRIPIIDADEYVLWMHWQCRHATDEELADLRTLSHGTALNLIDHEIARRKKYPDTERGGF